MLESPLSSCCHSGLGCCEFNGADALSPGAEAQGCGDVMTRRRGDAETRRRGD
ncbi:MAG: hypothetical protein F6K31_03570 [Symploca sp. SIO2G7]|nr:hypothetical protein [Symploca sp. SIO2G7]